MANLLKKSKGLVLFFIASLPFRLFAYLCKPRLKALLRFHLFTFSHLCLFAYCLLSTANCLLPTAYCQPFKISVQSTESDIVILTNAREAKNTGNLTSAIEHYKIFISKFPSSPLLPEVYFELSMCYVQIIAITTDMFSKINFEKELLEIYLILKDFENAEKLVLKLLDSPPKDISLKEKLAKIYIDWGKYKKAVEIYTNLLLEFPQEKRFENELFSIYEASGMMSNKIAELEAQKNVNNQDAMPYKTLAKIYLWQNKPIPVLRELEKVLELEPENVELSLLTAQIYIDNQWFSNAVDICKRLLDKNPNNLQAHKIFGNAYYAQEDKLNAMLEWQLSAVFDKTDLNSYFRLADILFEKKSYEEIINLYEKARKELKNDNLFTRELAALYENQMQYNDAVRELVNLLTQFPNEYPWVSSKLIPIVKNSEDTLKWASQFLKTYCPSHIENEGLIMLLSDVLSLQQNYSDAIPILENISKKRNDNGQILFDYGRQYISRGSYIFGAELLKKAVALNPLSPFVAPSLLDIAKTYLWSENFSEETRNSRLQSAFDRRLKPATPEISFPDMFKLEEAEKILRQIISQYPEISEARNASFLLAKLLFGKSRYDEAAEIFEKLRIDPQGGELVQLSTIKLIKSCILLGQFDKAKTLAEPSLSSPAYIKFFDELLFNLGEIEYYTGNYSYAADNYKKLTNAYPESKFVNDAVTKTILINHFSKLSPEDKKNLTNAETNKLTGKYDEAIAIYKNIENTTSDKFLKDFCQFTTGEILVIIGKNEEGIKILSELADSSDDADLAAQALLLAANVYVQISDIKTAMTLYQKIIVQFALTFWADEAREKASRLGSKMLY